MNIIEAIKSGNPIKRSHHNEWLYPVGSFVSTSKSSQTPYLFTVEDLTSEMWETKEPTITISKKEFLNIVQESFNDIMEKEGVVIHAPMEHIHNVKTNMIYSSVIGKIISKLWP